MRNLETTMVVVRDVDTDEHWLVSHISITDHGEDEVLAFPSDELGNVLSWRDEAGGIGCSVYDVIDELQSGKERSHRERMQEWSLAAA